MKVDSNGRELSAQQIEYFKDSKVRDKNGNLLTVYHGTENGNFTIFDKAKSDDELTFWFTSQKTTAVSYSNSIDNAIESEKGVYSVYLNLKNPFIYDDKHKEWNDLRLNGAKANTREVAKYAYDNGYDGVIFRDINDKGKYDKFDDGEIVGKDRILGVDGEGHKSWAIDIVKDIVIRTVPVTGTKMVIAKILVLFIFGIIFCVASTVAAVVCGSLTLEVNGLIYKLWLAVKTGVFITAGTLPLVVLVVFFSKNYIFSVLLCVFYSVLNLSATSLFDTLPKFILWLLPTPLTTFWSAGDMSNHGISMDLAQMSGLIPSTFQVVMTLGVMSIISVIIIDRLYKIRGE